MTSPLKTNGFMRLEAGHQHHLRPGPLFVLPSCKSLALSAGSRVLLGRERPEWKEVTCQSYNIHCGSLERILVVKLVTRLPHQSPQIVRREKHVLNGGGGGGSETLSKCPLSAVAVE